MKRARVFFGVSLAMLSVVLILTRDGVSQAIQKGLVFLQTSTPGVSQVGHVNVTGRVKAGALEAGSEGIRFADGSTQTSAAGSSVPSGGMIMTNSVTPPAGFEFTGQKIATTSNWVILDPLPVSPLYAHSAVWLNGGIIVMGGQTNATNALNLVYRYDPKLHTWTNLAPMSVARRNAGATIVNGKIYVFGGFAADGTALASSEVYDPVANTWINLPDMPGPRGGLLSVTVGSRAYCVGGWSAADGYASRCDIYNPQTNAWTAGPAMPSTRAYMAGGSDGSRIYVFFGLHSAVGGMLYAYSLTGSSWNPWREDSTIRAAGVWYGAKLWTLTESGFGNSWSDSLGDSGFASLSQRVMSTLVVNDEGRLFCIGGSGAGAVNNVVSLYTQPMYVHMKAY